MTPLEAVIKIEQAGKLSDLQLPKELRADAYRRLLVLVHPDKWPVAERNRADQAARMLGELYAAAIEKPPPSKSVGRWTIGEKLAEGHISEVYYGFDATRTAVIKIVSHKNDNDLMDAEYANLAALHADAEMRGVWHYLPCPLETLLVSGRQINVFRHEPWVVSLTEIRKQLGPIPFRHTVWMMNRLLSALYYIPRAGIVHGGIIPDHLLYSPTDHGLIIVGWGASTNFAKDKPIPIADPEAQKMGLYPPEVLRKLPACLSTDIYMAMKSLISVSEPAPKRFLPIVQHCTAESLYARPTDAAIVQERWRAAAYEEYGPPKFVELKLN